MGGTAWEVEVTAPVVPRGELNADDVADTDPTPPHHRKHHPAVTIINESNNWAIILHRQSAITCQPLINHLTNMIHDKIKNRQMGAAHTHIHVCIPHTDDEDDAEGMGNFDGLVPALGVDLGPL